MKKGRVSVTLCGTSVGLPSGSPIWNSPGGMSLNFIPTAFTISACASETGGSATG
jgi:hypothetical protein